MEEHQNAEDNREAPQTWRVRSRRWRGRIKDLAVSHAKQIVSAVVVGVSATLISTYLLSEMGVEDDDPVMQVVRGTSAENEAVKEVFVLQAKFAQVLSLMSLPKTHIAQVYVMNGKSLTTTAELDLSTFDLAEHPLIDHCRFVDEGKVHVELAGDFGSDRYLTLWSKASTPMARF